MPLPETAGVGGLARIKAEAVVRIRRPDESAGDRREFSLDDGGGQHGMVQTPVRKPGHIGAGGVIGVVRANVFSDGDAQFFVIENPAVLVFPLVWRRVDLYSAKELP